MRLFVGVFPPSPVRADLHRYLSSRRPAIRLTPPERWHVTLAFLGEVDAARLPEVEAAAGAVGLPEAAAGAVGRSEPEAAVGAVGLPEVEAAAGAVGRSEPEAAADVVGAREPMTLRIAGGGSFGGRRRGVLWAGLAGDVDALGRVQADLRAALVAAGLPHDERPFTPHLTVAYAVDPDLRVALDAYAGPEWPVGELTLVHSAGGTYDHLRAWPLVR